MEKSVYKNPGVYVKYEDSVIFSTLTNKIYSSFEELNRDIRKIKLEKINESWRQNNIS